MQKVSKAYKKSMKSPLRERGYIMLSFGLINQEAQAKATAENLVLTYYSNADELFDNKEYDQVYATLEQNYLKADGKMLFPPRENVGGFINTGVVSQGLVSGGSYELNINLNTRPITFKGLTIDFGANYPVEFDVVTDTGQVVTVTGNTLAKWKTEEVFYNVVAMKIVFKQMKEPHNRARVYSILFGYGLFYKNNEIIDSVLESYVSPIGADVPQIDFSVTLNNREGYFNVDNPDSAVNFLETGQEMDIAFGYQIPNEKIEWIKGNKLLCSDWESDQEKVVIRCNDVFRSMDGEYHKGKYSSGGMNYFDLAVSVLTDAGVTDYYVDPRLKTLTTKNPLPRVKHKEALQIIANACRCTLSQSRTGKIQIKSFFTPVIIASAETQATYSKVENILKPNVSKIEYAAFQKNYIKADGGMRLKHPDNQNLLDTGYVSAALSKADGTFDINPIITLTMESIRAYYGMRLDFGGSLPGEIIIRTYKENALIHTFGLLSDDIDKTTVMIEEFDECNKMQIEFVRTKEPFNRITLNNLSLTDVVNFTMEKQDIIGSLKAIKQELVKEVIVPHFTYQTSNEQQSIVSESVTTTANQIETYYFSEPLYGFAATLAGSSSYIEILEQGAYFVKVKFKLSGTYQVEIKGYKYKVIEKQVVKTINERGKTVRWNNPLIDNQTMATELADWLAKHYKSSVEYEYSTRGNPEMDASDIIYQENDFMDNMTVNVYRSRFSFALGFSGQVTARRVGGEG